MRLLWLICVLSIVITALCQQSRSHTKEKSVKKRGYKSGIFTNGDKNFDSQRRNLEVDTSPTNTIVKCNAFNHTIAFDKQEVKVYAVDTAGNNKTVGGDFFWIRVENQCTQSNGFGCYDVASQQTVLQTEIQSQMKDHLNGYYTYDFTVDQEGPITLYIMLYERGGLFYEWWDTTTWTGSVVSSGVQASVDNSWASGDNLTPTQADYVTARYVGALRGPLTGTVTLYAECDETCLVYIDNSLIINGGFSNLSATVNMVDNQFYFIQVDFYEGTDVAVFKLRWSYTGQTEVLIPSYYMYNPKYVGAGLYQIDVICPHGYVGNDTTSPTKCVELHGDGFKVGSEECEDGNTVNYDGCSQFGYIDEGYICYGGSRLGKDTCYQCPIGFNVSESKTECDMLGTGSGVHTCVIIICICIFIASKTSIVESIVESKYPNHLFTFVEQFQIILMLQFIHSFFPEIILTFLHAIRYLFFGFQFLGLDGYFYGTVHYDKLDYQMRNLGFGSQITIVNLTNWLAVYPIFLILYLILYFVLEKFIYQEVQGMLLAPMRKVTTWMFPGLLIKVIHLSFIMLVFLPMYELRKHWNTDEEQWSRNISIVILIFCGIYGVLVLIFCSCAVCFPEMRKDPYLAEYFGGLRDSRYAVMYPFLSLMYKAGIAMLCAARLDNSSSETLGYILLIHGVHIAYLLFFRPFSQAKDSVICMKNQVFVVSLLIPLFTYKDPEKWGTTITWGWIVSIISANAMTAFGLVVQFVTRMYKEYTLLPTGNEVRAINPKVYEKGFTPSSTTKKLNKVHNFDNKSQGGKSPHGEESFSPRMKNLIDLLNFLV